LFRKASVGLILASVTAAFLASCASAPQGAARGAELFQTCVPCHGPNGQGDLALRAPAIAGLPEWYVAAELTKFKRNIRGAHPDDNEGHRMRPMARTLYRPGDIETVAAHVAGLPPARVAPVLGGNVAAGQAHYQAICVACHGADGKGNQAMNSPPLLNQADWYMVEQLKKFKTGMRGAHPEDITGSQMRAMSSTLQDTVAMRDVVAYIKTLAP
jgi:cytochrome c553